MTICSLEKKQANSPKVNKMPFTYRPLITARNEIRLLRLRPAASFNEPLRVSLFHASLDAAPEFEALSYVWGKTWGEYAVWVEDGSQTFDGAGDHTKLPSLPITPNLDTALRHVRFRPVPAAASTPTQQDRILWVDALCINQQDPAERSRQVQQMRRIYEACVADVAYLGPHPSPPLTDKQVDDIDSDDEEAKAEQEVRAEGETDEQAQERKLAAKRAWKLRKAEESRLRAYQRRTRYLRNGLALMRQVADRDVAALSAMVQHWNKYAGYRYSESDDDDSGEEVVKDGKKKEKAPPKDEHDPDNPGQKRFLTSRQLESLYAAFESAELWSRVWIVQELSCAPRVLLAVGKRHEGELSQEEEEESEDGESEFTVVVGQKNGSEDDDTGDLLDTLDWDQDIVGGCLDDRAYVDAFHSSWGHGSVGPVAASIFAHVRSIQLQRQMIRNRGALQGAKDFVQEHPWHGRFSEESELEWELLKVPAGEEAGGEAAREETTAANVVPADPSLINVLARFKWTQSTDARDKVYGLLGLVAEAPRLPPVDYTQPVARVYSDAAIAIIETSGSLDVISQNPFDGDDGRDAGNKAEGNGDDGGRAPYLPSWAPNFDRSFYTDYYDEFATILFAQRGIYAAGKPDCRHLLPLKVEQGSVGVEGEDARIPFCSVRLRGAVLGRVDPLKQGPWEEKGQSYVNTQLSIELLHQYKKLYCSNGDGEKDDDQNEVYAPTGEPRWEAFWRTCVGDCTAYPIRRLTADECAQCSTGLTEVCRVLEAEIRRKEDTQHFTTHEEWKVYSEKHRHGSNVPSAELAESLPVSQMLRRMMRRWGMAQTLEDNKLPSGGGLLLMVRAVVEPGDVVAVLDGSKVPVVLRAQDVAVVKADETNNETVYYKYVCPAYVHGYMDGEAVAQVADGRLAEQDFVLV